MIGKTISHYRIVEKLGEGGMGVVYKAKDQKLKRTVALKFLPPELTRDPNVKKRFIKEAQAAAVLDHTNICNIHEIDETEDGQLFICMAYYEGESLRQKIKKGPIPIEKTLNIISQIALGLKTAHDKKIIHRDIKPGNILITNNEEVKIVDFGLAKLAGEKLTESYSTKGTIAYIAPELIRGSPGDQRSDIWSLGVVLYEMLTAHLPFKGTFPEPMMYAIVNKEPELLSYYLKNVPELLQNIINKLLRKDPQERYQTIEELLQDIKSLSKEAVMLREESFYQFIARVFRKRRIRYLTLSAATIIIIIISVIFLKPVFLKDMLYADPPPIAVISFENQTGNEAYDLWEKGIPNLLITKLEQSGGFRVVSWERLFDLKKQIGKDSIDFIDLDLGIQLCRLEGVEMIISGTLLKAGETFATDVKVYDVDSKNILKSTSASGKGENSILDSQIDQLGQEICQGLGLSVPMQETLQKPVKEVTTTSTKAYKYYIQARELYSHFREARPLLEQAVQLDTTFAAAYLELADVYNSLGLYKAKIEAEKKAIKYIEKLPEKERLNMEFNLYYRNLDKADSILQVYTDKFGWDNSAISNKFDILKRKGDYQQAIELYQKSDLRDSDPLLYNWTLGYLYLRLNDYNKALDCFRKYVDLAPNEEQVANAYDCIGEVYMKMGDVDAMIATFKEVYRIDPKTPWSYKKLALSYLWKEDYEQAIHWSQLDDYTERPDRYFYFTGIYNYLAGRWTQASTDLEKAIQIADSIFRTGELPSTVWNAPYIKALLYYEQGEYAKGWKEIKRTTNYTTNRFQEYIYLDTLRICKYKAMTAIQTGQLAVAKEQRQQLAHMYEDSSNNAWQRSVISYFQNLIEIEILRAKDSSKNAWQRSVISYFQNLIEIEILLASDSASAALELAKQINFDQYDLFDFGRLLEDLFPFQYDITARALLQMDKLDLAIKEYERLTSDDPNLRGWHPIPARYHYILGKLYERKGWPGKAIDRYEHFLKVWHHADADILEISEAQKRLRILKNNDKIMN